MRVCAHANESKSGISHVSYFSPLSCDSSAGLATANNHQLPAASSASSPSVEALGKATGSRLLVRATEEGDEGAQQLVDNKIHDKLQQQRVAERQKREDVFSDNVLTNNYAPHDDQRWRGQEVLDGDHQEPQITEEVLLVSNLTEERLREENELLEHLNR
ncbi:hypothetical protein ZHAS_00015137 [Anopheles sinensis]|uniref:Uncharacterized protein n=1 Tax=Anopheles sinensis TaxID=74873 RepID=A0A084WA47_ANOSI|nr:hypothetical protein ZHAS_00015137 [Anopheles sinensis]